MKPRRLRCWIGEEPLNTRMCHEEESIPLIQKLVLDFKPELIVEFGTCTGGMTLLFHQCCPAVPLHSFDNVSMASSLGKIGRMNKKHIERFQEQAFGDSVTFYITDIFHKGRKQVEEIVKQPVKKLLYCDNGKKHDEMRLFGSLLLEGDLLGVHDWGFEVGYDYPGVIQTLVPFTEHPMNKLFIKNNLSSRFFRRLKDAI